MLILKMMSGEDLPDDFPSKSYDIQAGVKSVRFHRDLGAPIAEVLFAGEDEPIQFPLDGNAYLMNENGKTISSFGCAPPVTPPDLESVIAGCGHQG